MPNCCDRNTVIAFLSCFCTCHNITVNCLWILCSSCCCIRVNAHVLCCKRAPEFMCVYSDPTFNCSMLAVEKAFLGMAQSILKIHTPQINTMSLNTGAMAPHCPQVCVYLCVCVYKCVCVTLCTCIYRKKLKWCTACFIYSNFPLCAYCWHVCLWLICGTIQSWPLIWASSALHPPTGCQCLKWRGCDITALDTQWPLCALTASDASLPQWMSGNGKAHVGDHAAW